MKTGLLSNLYFAKNSEVTIQFMYCGAPSITGFEHNEKLLECENVTSEVFEKKLITEQQQWNEFKQSVLYNLEDKFNDLVNSIKASMPEYIFKFLKLIIPQIELQEENIKCLIDNVLNDCSIDDDIIIIKISKNDAKWIKNLQNTFASKKVAFDIDESLSSGDVVLKTSLGEIDAKLSTMLDELLNSIKNN